MLVTVLAPISWGTTYVTVTELLPEGRPLLIAATRAPGRTDARRRRATVVALAARGSEWRRTALLALCNFALFFPLLAVAVYRLPGGVAAAGGLSRCSSPASRGRWLAADRRRESS